MDVHEIDDEKILQTLRACVSYCIIPKEFMPGATFFSVRVFDNKKCMMALRTSFWDEAKHKDVSLLVKQVDYGKV